MLSDPPSSLFHGTKDQGGPARPEPTLHSIQAQNASLLVGPRQTAGATQRAPGLSIGERRHPTAWGRNPQKQQGLPRQEAWRWEVHIPGSFCPPGQPRGGFCSRGHKLVPSPPTSQPHSREQGGEGLRAEAARQLPLALLIRKTVISQQVPPGRFPLPAHQPELSHIASPSCKLAEAVKCFSWYKMRVPIDRRKDLGRPMTFWIR